MDDQEVRVSVLGPVQVTRGDRVVDLGGPKPRLLLARLALSAGREVTYDTLVDAVWGDDPPTSARKLLQKYVWQLRRTVGDSQLATGSEGYVLRVDHDAVDALRMERLFSAGRAARVGGDLRTAWDRLDAALRLVRGPPLAGVDDMGFGAHEARRLNEVLLSAEEERLEIGLELGRHDELLPEIEQLAARHPYRERLSRCLLLALYRSGRQRDALQTYQQIREALVDTLGVDPSPELVELEGKILRHDPDLRVAGTVPSAGDPSRRPAAGQRIQFAVAPDGTRLAFATSGTGPPLVKAANWMTHLDHDLESPLWKDTISGLCRNQTIIRYDERGCGLSDWDVDRFDFEVWIDDLEVIVDASGQERFPLLGISQGGAVAIGYAVRHPERVSHLILWGAYARGRRVRAETDEDVRAAEMDIELARLGWGTDEPTFRQVFTSQFIPDGTRADWDALNEMQRISTSSRNAVRFMETFASIDVTSIAPQVRCPTLVIHSTGDVRVPFESARELASLIPGSRIVPVQSRNHMIRQAEPDYETSLQAIRELVAEE